MDSTRDAVDYIKGVCIFIIAWGHLIFNNFQGKFTFFGNQFVAFFFIVSGYGIYLSISKSMAAGCAFDILGFYRKRFVRIFPLYWLWFGVASLTSYTLDWSDFFLCRMYDPPAWFLNAIMHCYIVAPLLYFTAKRLGWWSLPVFCLMLYAVNVLFRLMGAPDMLVYAYRKIYLFHIFLFALGMLLPLLLSIKIRLKQTTALITVCFVLFLLASLQTSSDRVELLDLTYIKLPYFHLNKYNIVLALSALAITYVMLQARPRMPLQDMLMVLGKYSLPIYLFHTYYVNGIVVLLGTDLDMGVYFIVFTAFFPVLLNPCMLFQTWTDTIGTGVAGVATRLYGRSKPGSLDGVPR